MSVRSHASNTALSKLHENFRYMLTASVARSSSDNKVLCNVLPVLWMTLCSPIMGRVARGNNDAGALLKQVVKISNVFARVRHAV